VYSVGELTLKIKGLLEGQIGQVWVSGEITNFRAQSSGHLYFTLKDAASQLSCVLFRGTAVSDRGSLKDGQKVVLQGRRPDGVRAAGPVSDDRAGGVELQGIGALQAAFERLKQKLQAEGLFDPARKRPLPRFPPAGWGW
jgi:exodeoxyribonuclease VII large subunit